MGDGGKGRTGRAKKREAKAKAAAKLSPAKTAAAPPDPAADEPAAPVGFTARNGAGEAKPGDKPGAKPAKKRAAAVVAGLAAVVAVVAVAGYLTRAAWLPKSTDHKPAVIAAKPEAAAKPAAEPASKPAAKPPAAAPASEGAAEDPLVKEREQLRAELNRLMARLDGVETSMDTAKKMIRATAPPADKLGGGPSLEQLSERVGELEKREAALKELAKRVDKMEKTAAEGAGAAAAAGGAQAVVLAVAALNDAIARGEPYDKHLETLKAIGGGDPNVKATLALLSKGAVAGIPTLATLRERFDAMAGGIVHASKMQDDGGWMARAANRISSLITWRRVGDGATGDSVDRVVARAEARLKAGDLAGAVKALDGLAANKNAAAAAEPWLADAKARVTAERAVASLHVHAVSLLTPAKP